jgi:hypothetical protein
VRWRRNLGRRIQRCGGSCNWEIARQSGDGQCRVKNEHFWMASRGAVVGWGERRLKEGSEEGAQHTDGPDRVIAFHSLTFQ